MDVVDESGSEQLAVTNTLHKLRVDRHGDPNPKPNTNPNPNPNPKQARAARAASTLTLTLTLPLPLTLTRHARREQLQGSP